MVRPGLVRIVLSELDHGSCINRSNLIPDTEVSTLGQGRHPGDDDRGSTEEVERRLGRRPPRPVQRHRRVPIFKKLPRGQNLSSLGRSSVARLNFCQKRS